MGKNYYEILEVSKDATSDEIRKAYKRLACEYHPDRNKSPDAEEKFKEISKAYKVLSEPESKSKYDQFGEEGLEGFESNFNPSSFFQQFFSGNMGNMGNFFQENNDVPPVETVIEATLEEIFTGCTKNITIERFNTCTTCNNSIKKCQKCMGNGIMRFVVNNRLQQVSCKSCNGTGRQDGKDACKKCNSIGFIKEKHSLNINIPAGVDKTKPIIIKRGDPLYNIKFHTDDQNDKFDLIYTKLDEVEFKKSAKRNYFVQHRNHSEGFDYQKIIFESKNNSGKCPFKFFWNK